MGIHVNDMGMILQARMGSSRLPGKILKIIGDKTLLGHIFYRVSFLKHPVKLVLATSNKPGDNIVEEFCQKNGVECFRGSENHVLERYYLCSKKYGFDNIIRITGDNPFPDIEEIDRLIDLHIISGADYSQSSMSLPVGTGAEIFTFNALEKSYLEGKKQNHIEHVNEYIQENPEIFKISLLAVPDVKNRPDIRLTIDTEEDYNRACFIVNNSKNEYITTEEAISLCSQFA